jgi:magnesium-transporting ATPase (P-type)
MELEQAGSKNVADKHEIPSPILMSGTKVLTGEGKMMVIVVGNKSCIGKIRMKLNQDEET